MSLEPLQAEEQAYQKALEAAQAQALAEAAAQAAKARARAGRRSASVASEDSDGGWMPSAQVPLLAPHAPDTELAHNETVPVHVVET